MKLIKQVNSKLENGFAKNVFDHIRNLLMCTLLLAIGTNQLQEKNEMIFSVTQGKYVGVSIIVFSFILTIINSYDGLRVINKAKFHILIAMPLMFLYLFIIIKILEMGWDFRVVESIATAKPWL